MGRRGLKFILKYRVLIVLIILFVVASLLSKSFLTTRNVQNILLQVAINGIIAVGMTFVIITAGIDLSVGSVLALGGVIAIGLQSTVGPVVASGAALAAGLIIGLTNGLLVTKVGVNPFISTLAMLTVVRGLALGLTGTRPISGSHPGFADLARTPLLGIPMAAVIFLVILFACQYILTSTSRGRSFYAVGGNEEASRLAGINNHAYQIAAYAFTSFLAALGGVLLASRINTGSPIVGNDTPLVVISAVLLGGTSMTGGSGTLIGTLQGILVLGILNNGMNLVGIADFYQTVVLGTLLVLVMVIDRYSVARAAKARA